MDERYLLLLLSDSNLPTGGFISSSGQSQPSTSSCSPCTSFESPKTNSILIGLESYVQHGFLLESPNDSIPNSLLSFIQKSLHTFSKTSLPFLTAAHSTLATYSSTTSSLLPEAATTALETIQALDREFESITLNSVSKRNSKQQGIALLTLYSRSLASEEDELSRGKAALVEEMKKIVRAGEINGHHVICFGVITAALGLSLGESLIPSRKMRIDEVVRNLDSAQHLFLFLFARSILSSAVRLNTIGPYVSHRLLLHEIKELVNSTLVTCKNADLAGIKGAGPSTSWPLGEILAARHDSLHSKIFNS